jgi:hypothetical protein
MPSSSSDWMDYLKFDGKPTFDVLQKTIEYTSEPGYRSFSLKDIPTDYYSDEYIFRGPIVGPINRKDLVVVNGEFNLAQSFPDLDRQPFGFSVDPENSYRVLFFERWKATNTGVFDFLNLNIPPTGNRSESPVMPFSIVWSPDGKIIYEHLTTAVDRFEGNTKGKVAVFGLLETAGLSINNNVGDPLLVFQQQLGSLTGAPKVFSKEKDIPSWWKSKARGAQSNDM